MCCGRDELRSAEKFFINPHDNSFVLQNDFDKTLKPPQIFKFQTIDNCLLYGMIFMPNNYMPNVKYPTILYVYGGPKVQLVSNTYKANK
jgi:dipeptidyl aminopeptidase/acylaminoacyl peptidase